MVALADFLSERLPQLRDEWYVHRDQLRKVHTRTEPDLSQLRERAARGDHDAVDQLIELATELDDMEELRRLANRGNVTAAEQLQELTAE